MFGVRTLIFCLVAAAGATSDSPFCSRSFSEAEWQEEAASYLLNVKELQQHLQPEPYFLSKMLLLTMGKPQSFLELTGTALVKSVPLNGSYMSVCALVLLLMLAFYFARRKHEFVQFPLLSRLIVEKARAMKCLKIGIVLLLAVAALYCLKGIGEGSRQEKVINHLLCRILDSQKFIKKNNTILTYNQTWHISLQIFEKMYGENFKAKVNLLMKLRHAYYPQKIIEDIIKTLKSETYQGSLLQQLESANERLHLLSEFTIRPQNGEDECQLKIIDFVISLLSLNQKLELIKDLRSDRIKDVNLNKFPENTVMIGRIFFLAVLVIAVIACVLLLGKEERYNQPGFDRLSFAFFVITILCFITVLLTTLFLSFNFWAYQAEQSMINDSRLCHEQPQASMELCRAVSQRSNNFSQSFYVSEVCKSHYDKFDYVTRPYLAKNDSYFYDLMVRSTQMIRDQASKSMIMEKIAAKNAKIPLVAIMKSMSAKQAQIFNLQKEIQGQKINFVQSFESLMKLLGAHSTNSTYEIRQICKALSITSSIILFFISIIKWLIKKEKGHNKRISSQNQASTELTEVDLGTQMKS